MFINDWFIHTKVEYDTNEFFMFKTNNPHVENKISVIDNILTIETIKSKKDINDVINYHIDMYKKAKKLFPNSRIIPLSKDGVYTIKVNNKEIIIYDDKVYYHHNYNIYLSQ